MKIPGPTLHPMYPVSERECRPPESLPVEERKDSGRSERLRSACEHVFGTYPDTQLVPHIRIPQGTFSGLSALFPEGLRRDSVVGIVGHCGSGVTRLLAEVATWASRELGFCLLFDSTLQLNPALLLSCGTDTDRLLILRPRFEQSTRSDLQHSQARRERHHKKLLSALGVAIDSFSAVVILANIDSSLARWIERSLPELQARARRSRTLVVMALMDPVFVTQETTRSRRTAVFERILRGTSPSVLVRQCSWSRNSHGLLFGRSIEAVTREHGSERVVLLEDRADSGRLRLIRSNELCHRSSRSEEPSTARPA
jgi:hypothetical protein